MGDINPYELPQSDTPAITEISLDTIRDKYIGNDSSESFSLSHLRNIPLYETGTANVYSLIPQQNINFTSFVNKSFIIAPANISSLNIEEATKTDELIVSWTGSSYDGGDPDFYYIISATEYGQSNPTKTISTQGEKTHTENTETITLTGLSSFTRYSVKVLATNKSTLNQFTVSNDVGNKTLALAPTVVKNDSTTTSSTAAYTYTLPSSLTSNGYNLTNTKAFNKYYDEVDTKERTSVSTNGVSNISGIEKNTNVYLSVYITDTNDKRLTINSIYVTNKTLNIVLPDSIVVSVDDNNITTTKIPISWSLNGGIGDFSIKYDYEISTSVFFSPMAEHSEKRNGITSTEIDTAISLRIYTKYYFRIRGYSIDENNNPLKYIGGTSSSYYYFDDNQLSYRQTDANDPNFSFSLSATEYKITVSLSNITFGTTDAIWRYSYKEDGGSYTSRSIIEVSNNTFNFDVSKDNTKYFVRVKLTNDAGLEKELTSSVTTLLNATVPESTTISNFTSITSSSITVNWNTPTDGGAAITKYHLQRSTDNKNWTDVSSSITGNSRNVTGLDNFRTYYFKVKAYNSIGWGNYGSSSSSKTLAVAPAKITSTSISENTKSTFKVSWTNLTGEAKGGKDYNNINISDYKVRYVDKSNNSSSVTSTSTPKTVDVGDNNSAKEYKVYVSAKNNLVSSYGSESDAIYTGTKPEKITNISRDASGTTTTSLKIQWTDPPNGDGIEKIVQLLNSGGSVISGQNDIVNVNNYYTFTNLSTYTGYKLKIYARITLSDLTFILGDSETTTFLMYTKAGTPGTISTPSASYHDQNSINYSWTAPTTGGRAVTYDWEVYNNFKTGNTSSTSVRVTGLAAGTYYYFRVRAKHEDGTGSWSNWKHERTKLGTPSEYTNAKNQSYWQSQSEIRFKLNNNLTSNSSKGGPAASITYQYKVWENNGSLKTNWTDVVYVNSSTHIIKITGLSCGATYKFRFRGRNQDNMYGNQSPEYTERTAYCNPYQVTSISVTGRASNSLTVSWTAPSNSGSPFTYTVSSSSANANSWTQKVTGHSSTSYTITGLSRYTLYDIRISATNTDGFTGNYNYKYDERTRAERPTITNAYLRGRYGYAWLDSGIYDRYMKTTWRAPSDWGGASARSSNRYWVYIRRSGWGISYYTNSNGEPHIDGSGDSYLKFYVDGHHVYATVRAYNADNLYKSITGDKDAGGIGQPNGGQFDYNSVSVNNA